MLYREGKTLHDLRGTFATRLMHNGFEEEKHLKGIQHLRPRRSPEEQLRSLRFGLKSHEKLIELIAAGQAQVAEAHWLAHMEAAAKYWAGDLGTIGVIDFLD